MRVQFHQITVCLTAINVQIKSSIIQNWPRNSGKYDTETKVPTVTDQKKRVQNIRQLRRNVSEQHLDDPVLGSFAQPLPSLQHSFFCIF